MSRARRCLAIAFLAIAFAAIAQADVEGVILFEREVIPGASVSLRGGGQTRFAVSDAEGRYRIPVEGSGSYEITAELSGFARETAVICLDDRDQKVDFELRIQATICVVTIVGADGVMPPPPPLDEEVKGQVVDAENEPVGGAIVHVVLGGERLATAYTNAAGEFRVPVKAGLRVNVEIAAARFANRTFTGVTARETSRFRLFPLCPAGR